MRRVADIMTTNCLTVTPLDNIYEAALVMKNHNLGFVPVVENGKLQGVITDRDLVVRGYAEKNPGSTSVMDVLSKDLVTVSPNVSVDEAAELMTNNQIRRLPVVENGKLIGILSLGDLAVRNIFVNEAGDALSGISESSEGAHFH